MRLAFIGHGHVGGALARHLGRLGHQVTIAVRQPGGADITALRDHAPGLREAPVDEAVRASDVVFLATPFQPAEAIVRGLGAVLGTRVLVDCTNPVGPGLVHGLGSARAGAEVLQAAAPEARVVKAFSVYGYENLEDNTFPAAPLRPAMFYCGNDQGAKDTVGQLIADLGWEPFDVGPLAQALHLEHMTLLWIRMVRAGGRSPHLAWAVLQA